MPIFKATQHSDFWMFNLTIGVIPSVPVAFIDARYYEHSQAGEFHDENILSPPGNQREQYDDQKPIRLMVQ